MPAADVVVLVSACVLAIAVIVLVVVTVGLRRRVNELQALAQELRRETVPLVRDARLVVDQAATEMVRVGDVLGSAEAVSATVDSASRLAYRAFSNPLVKVVAYGSGIGGALRRLFGRDAESGGSGGATRAPARPGTTREPGPQEPARRHLRHLRRKPSSPASDSEARPVRQAS